MFLTMKHFITQSDFFQKLDTHKYARFQNNLCWIINIFLVLKEQGCNISESEIFKKAIEMDAYDTILGWKYDKLIAIYKYFCLRANNIEIFAPKIFHNRRLKKLLYNLESTVFLASLKLDENHIVIIDRVDGNNIYYTSVWTKEYTAVANKIIKMDDFFDVYNWRGIVIRR